LPAALFLDGLIAFLAALLQVLVFLNRPDFLSVDWLLPLALAEIHLSLAVVQGVPAVFLSWHLLLFLG